MQIDLRDKWIKPTHYTLRHYDTWATECLRNWILEASNDEKHWTPIKAHKGDTGLNGIGGTCTWPIESKDKFRIFRIRQTGPNSNNHFYLPCSGFEIYGKLFSTEFNIADPDMVKATRKQMMTELEEVMDLKYESDFDKNGLVYWMGTRGL